MANGDILFGCCFSGWIPNNQRTIRMRGTSGPASERWSICKQNITKLQNVTHTIQRTSGVNIPCHQNSTYINILIATKKRSGIGSILRFGKHHLTVEKPPSDCNGSNKSLQLTSLPFWWWIEVWYNHHKNSLVYVWMKEWMKEPKSLYHIYAPCMECLPTFIKSLSHL